ncbi:DUF4064 domain-containing protein [Staphylococcus pasteuri]|uniref:DUF4064 domain-containing protein n=1 Tax=Staphylococcus pasteuri TaxID=45972 RepID=UPI001E3DE1A5|nr:DUF4064 domain-containing protein [Staphylococcus pasteuri]MCD9067472.1 DUF4064 domain-containing protein [Staphylococcus pasteuri]WAE41814.1 DUF4064 domain-containing protein [Staphylococcus pasteuri]
MKRTTEKVLIWTGIAIHIIGLLLATITLIGFYITPETTKADTILFTSVYILTIVFLVIAIIAITKINKNNKLAGILLVVIGVLSLIPNFISAILWLIAGIMLLTRKPKNNKYGINKSNDKSESKENNEKDLLSNDPFEKKETNDNEEDQLKEDVEDPFKY